MKRVLAMVLAVVLIFGLVACGTKDNGNTASPNLSASKPVEDSSSGSEGGEKKDSSLVVSGMTGSLFMLPIYVGELWGSYEEAGLTFERVDFTGGPVQMEAMSSWDIALTGVGGVLSGVVGWDGYVVGAMHSDVGSQQLFARTNSNIVAAGTGNNRYSNAIYGDAESWKQATVLCNTGTVKEYVLLKVLEGFGLTRDDITIMSMDNATTYSAFLAGEGDVAMTSMTDTVTLLTQPEEFTAVATARDVGAGLMCNFVANPDSYEDAETREAMKVFLSVYFDVLEWLAAEENFDEAVSYLMDMKEEDGSAVSLEVAQAFLKNDELYSLESVVEMMKPDANGSCAMEESLVEVLRFFINDVGSYAEGDDEIFLGHVDGSMLEEILAER